MEVSCKNSMLAMLTFEEKQIYPLLYGMIREYNYVAEKVSKYGAFSGRSMIKYLLEKAPYSDISTHCY